MLVSISPYSSFMNCLVSLLPHHWYPNPILNTWAFAQLVVPDHSLVPFHEKEQHIIAQCQHLFLSLKHALD